MPKLSKFSKTLVANVVSVELGVSLFGEIPPSPHPNHVKKYFTLRKQSKRRSKVKFGKGAPYTSLSPTFTFVYVIVNLYTGTKFNYFVYGKTRKLYVWWEISVSNLNRWLVVCLPSNRCKGCYIVTCAVPNTSLEGAIVLKDLIRDQIVFYGQMKTLIFCLNML